jgi:hypothetical protein
MNKLAIALSLSVLAGLGGSSSLKAQTAAPALSEADAQQIATEAYLYLYPLVMMDVTRKQLTNMPGGGDIGGPPNTFNNIASFPDVTMRAVVRPNFDTLYSTAWLDLTKEPAVISVPDTRGRYYLLPMLDMWTDVFASPGWRTTGTGAGNFLVAPIGWRPDLRDRFVEEFRLPKDIQRIDAPTPHVWIIGRTKTDGPPDYDAVHKIQAGFKITPLSQWGRDAKPAPYKIDTSVDVKTPPKTQVDTMAGPAFFAHAAELLKTMPPHLTDQPILARMKRMGLDAGKSFDPDRTDANVKKAIEAAPKMAQQLMAWKLPTMARVANGWSMNTDTMGVYGDYYLKRAIIAQQGLGANVPQDAVYPFNQGDQTGRPLDGASKYTLTFDANNMPPVAAFWSVTLYDDDGFQVANPINRFAVSSWMPFQYGPDGSLTLYVQNENPGPDKEANWLPAPKGPFNLTMRLYAPKPDVLVGKWNPPAVTRAPGLPGLAIQ